MGKGLGIGIAFVAAISTFVTVARAEPVQILYQGLHLNGELTVPPGRSIADGVVLVTHGTLAHNGMETIVTLRDALAERGIPSLAITLSFGVDNRTGFYDCAKGVNRHRHDGAIGEIGAWVGWLKGQGTNRIVLMGHSRGGNQTAWYAAEHDEPAIEAVVLLAPATSDRENAAAEFKRRYGRDLAALLKKASAMPPDGLLKDVPLLQCPHATATAASFLSYYADEPRRDTPTLLPRIAKPTLVIAGSRDTVVTGLKERVAPMTSDRLHFAEVDGADHFFLDLFMDEVADDIDKFLGERR